MYITEFYRRLSVMAWYIPMECCRTRRGYGSAPFEYPYGLECGQTNGVAEFITWVWQQQQKQYVE